MESTFSFSEMEGITSGINDNIVMILQGGAFDLGTMLHLLISRNSLTLSKRLNNSDFIIIPIAKVSKEVYNLKADGSPYSTLMELNGNKLIIIDATGDIHTVIDDDILTINPSRATFQIGPLSNAQYIGKFHNVAVGEKGIDYDMTTKNGVTKTDLIPLINNVANNINQIDIISTQAIHAPNWINISQPPYNSSPNSDITTILQNAINSLTRGTVFVPDGDYLINQTIKLKLK
ncbi:hypothetical protein [Paenibacillus protaetiae]|uniref:Uncharacterized protein n=1 Tax=Paenibacillus protaetiae TaxID=2509456 RepID=A0A4P6EU73_9BACL|nr:hypothetical protein [Paenibacillus protaetiae]QAY66780.1 hypothetical protein ET464_10530 [Paenibacillus protaetiae]